MNPRIVIKATLPLLFCAAVAGAQIDPLAPPPMKMGLWQSTTTMQMSGMPNMPNMPAGKPIVNQACMSQESWQKDMTALQNRQQQKNVNCTPPKVEKDTQKFTVDVACTAQQGYNTSVHVEMFLDSEESMHGTSTVKMSGPSLPQGMSMTASIQSKYLGADCGGLQPGQSKTITE